MKNELIGTAKARYRIAVAAGSRFHPMIRMVAEKVGVLSMEAKTSVRSNRWSFTA